MRRFLQLALDLVDDLVFHLLDRGARPDRLHDHDAEGEIRVFLLAHAHQAEHAGDDDQAEQEARDARMADRPARQIEGPLVCVVWSSASVHSDRAFRCSIRCGSGAPTLSSAIDGLLASPGLAAASWPTAVRSSRSLARCTLAAA